MSSGVIDLENMVGAALLPAASGQGTKCKGQAGHDDDGEDAEVRVGEDAFNGPTLGQDDDGEEDDDDDEEGGGLCDEGASMVSSLCEVCLPEGRKIPQCFLCKRKANDPSPLVSARPDDKYGGKVPWNSYKKVKKDGKVVRIPKGNICLISRNAFNAIGYHITYGYKGKMKNYKKAIAAPNGGPEIHLNFLAAEKEWVSQHNSKGNAVIKPRLRDKKYIGDLRRRLEVNNKKSWLQGTQKQFIEQDAWDEKWTANLMPQKSRKQWYLDRKEKAFGSSRAGKEFGTPSTRTSQRSTTRRLRRTAKVLSLSKP